MGEYPFPLCPIETARGGPILLQSSTVLSLMAQNWAHSCSSPAIIYARGFTTNVRCQEDMIYRPRHEAPRSRHVI